MNDNGNQPGETLADQKESQRLVNAGAVTFTLPLSEIRAWLLGLFSVVGVLATSAYNLGAKFEQIGMLEKRVQDLQGALDKKIGSDEVEISLRYWKLAEKMDCALLDNEIQRMLAIKTNKGCKQ